MEPLEYIIIDSEEECNIACSQLLNEKYISIDTEFFRQEGRFELSVIQIGAATNNYLIDFVALNFNIPKNLRLLFENSQVVKIFHDHTQDLEILNGHYEIILSNIFDTQVAMMFLTDSEIYSYKDLVKKFLKVEVDKTHKLDAWEVRPLTQPQMDYAISDVFLPAYSRKIN
jgi:ribonuclease D